MPLLPNVLRDSLKALFDRIGATQTALTPSELAGLWCDAIDAYFSGLTNPSGPATSASLAAAKGVLNATLTAGFATPGTGLVALVGGLSVYTATIAAGSAPFVATPPVGPAPIVAGPPATTDVAATTLAAAIDAWARTGTASVSPAPPAPWS